MVVAKNYWIPNLWQIHIASKILKIKVQHSFVLPLYNVLVFKLDHNKAYYYYYIHNIFIHRELFYGFYCAPGFRTKISSIGYFLEIIQNITRRESNIHPINMGVIKPAILYCLCVSYKTAAWRRNCPAVYCFEALGWDHISWHEATVEILQSWFYLRKVGVFSKSPMLH